MICGTGTNDTRHSRELTKAAAEAGADAALVVAPYYNKPNRAGLRAHFEAVAEAAPELPMIIYNIPARVVINMSPGFLSELSSIDNVVAVKQANDEELGPIEGMAVLAGNDGVFLRALELGLAGGILVSSHLVGERMREMWDAAQGGDLERAREIDAELRPVYEALSVTQPGAAEGGAGDARPLPAGGCGCRSSPPTASSGEVVRDALERVGLPAALLEMAKTLRVLPLGGLGEIGKNMTVVEYDGRIVVVDTGLMFPTAEMLGIDLVLPDFSYLRERADDIEAIVLTHGHEDHVGALPYVLREIGEPPVIYGGLLTIGMVRSKLDEHKLSDAPLQELPAGERVQAGPFELELVHLSHSIPDARGVLLNDRAGLGAVHRRLQVRPDPGRRPPRRHLAPRGAGPRRPAAALRRLDQRRPAGDRALGVERRPGAAGDLRRLRGAHRRHLLRLQHPPRPAGDRRRREARPPRRPGRPLDAQELQHRLQPRASRRRRPASSSSRGRSRTSPTRRWSCSRPAARASRSRRCGGWPTTTTATSSCTPATRSSSRRRRCPATSAPSTKRSTTSTRSAPRVVTAKDAPIHASGHGWQEELKLMINLTKPRYVLPVHGDHKRLRLHAELAHSVGIDPANVFQGRNGLPLEIDERGARFGEDVHAGVIFVDGVDVGEPDDVALRDRREISADGIFIVVATISSVTTAASSPTPR